MSRTSRSGMFSLVKRLPALRSRVGKVGEFLSLSFDELFHRFSNSNTSLTFRTFYHYLFSFFQFTSNEKYCIRQVSTELQVYESATISGRGVVGRLRLEGMTSFEVGPGEKPSVAVFFGEKKVSGEGEVDMERSKAGHSSFPPSLPLLSGCTCCRSSLLFSFLHSISWNSTSSSLSKAILQSRQDSN